MAAEQRRDPRVPLVARVQIRTPSLETLAEELSGNVSMGGMFIRTAKPLEVGSAVQVMVIETPTGRELFDALGKVVWVRPKNDPDTGEPAGVGIEFTQMSEQSRAALRSMVGMGGPPAA